jgi:hypothetical protein
MLPEDIETDEQQNDTAESFGITAQAGCCADGLSQV